MMARIYIWNKKKKNNVYIYGRSSVVSSFFLRQARVKRSKRVKEK